MDNRISLDRPTPHRAAMIWAARLAAAAWLLAAVLSLANGAWVTALAALAVGSLFGWVEREAKEGRA